MNVSTILDQKGREVFKIAASASIAEAASMLTDLGVGALMVVDLEDRIVGVISERDIVIGMANKGADLHDIPVPELMTTDVINCALHDSVVKAMAMMTKHRVRHLPVYEDDQLQGIISIGDAVKYRIGEIEAEAEALRDYIAT